MKQQLLCVVIICLIPCALTCGKGRKKGGKGKPADNGGNVIERMVGKDVQTSPYAASGDDPVSKCEDLNCNFDSSCCWSNNQPPADQLNWVQASGQPEATKMQTSFGTSTLPQGNYLLTASEVAGTSEQSAEMYSCPITCANGDVTIKVKHWQSSGTSIQVCQLSSPADAPAQCKTLPSASGQEDTVTIPGGQGTRLAIIAKGFTAAKGTVAIIDDITVTCEICPDTTTAAPATDAPTTAPPPAALPPCKEIQCNFESGNPCSYSQSSAGGNAFKNWGAESAPYNNPLTGVKKPSPDGQKFGATYLKKKGEKSTLTTNANFDKDYVVRFDYYKATEGVDLQGCCGDSASNCPFDTTADVQVSHYKVWRKGSMVCPAGTKQVQFVADNQKGVSEGAVGLDNIQLLQAAGGSADSASTPACTS